MEIKSASDASQACDKLRSSLSKLKYNPDLYRMLKNIAKMGDEISKLEVECRRTRNYLRLEKPLEQINQAIKHLEHLIFIAQLMD